MQKKLLMQAEHIALSFGEQKVLDIDRFAVYQGERIGLVGANGAGKTTFLRVLSGELEPDAGTVKRMCDVHFFRQFSEGIDPFELEGKEMKAMRIQDKVWQETVSGGEDTRMRLAWMFSSGKMLVFLDEPTANLDMKGIALLKQKLLELDEVKLEFTEEALEAIADKAMERDTGARALRSIIEDFMLDIMYEIPKDDNIGRVTITKEYIQGTGGPVIDIRGNRLLEAAPGPKEIPAQ